MAEGRRPPSAPTLSEATREAAATRQQRLAEAMRQNLVKRKRQQRALAVERKDMQDEGDTEAS